MGELDTASAGLAHHPADGAFKGEGTASPSLINPPPDKQEKTEIQIGTDECLALYEKTVRDIGSNPTDPGRAKLKAICEMKIAAIKATMLEVPA